MKIVTTPLYEYLGAEFQFEWVKRLKNSLKKYGVPDDVAKEIVGDFTFDFSMLFDQGEIESQGQSCQPLVGFLNDDDELILNPGTFEFHEYAFGSTDEAFERP